MSTTNALSKAARMLSVLALGAAIAAPVLTAPSALAQDKGKDAKPAATSGSEKDVVIFRNGKVVEGQILEETATTVRMKILVAGIGAETTFDKTEILSITRAAKADPGKKGDKAATPVPSAPATKDAGAAKVKPVAETSEGKKVYTIELTGTFGEEISETPIRQAVKDAQNAGADYLIVIMDNDWSLKKMGGDGDIPDEIGQFDQLFRSEKIDPIFNEEIPREWKKQPEVIFWVKKAMGGAAFLPLNCPNIYFAGDAKMGGVGHLEEIFGSTGDKVVQEKQFALRLKHAEGKAIKGGYDPRIVTAMARTEYVLSYRMVGGKAELLERTPQGPDEFLLTDDGQGDNKDGEIALARGEGNDCLTLTADIANKLGISKGTVDSLPDLLFQLGVSRTATIVNQKQSDQIMKSWRDGLDNAKHALPRLWHDYNEVEVKPPGQYRERTQARGRRMSILNEMIGIERKYEEALHPHQLRVPDISELEALKKQIELQQSADKPEKK